MSYPDLLFVSYQDALELLNIDDAMCVCGKSTACWRAAPSRIPGRRVSSSTSPRTSTTTGRQGGIAAGNSDHRRAALQLFRRWQTQHGGCARMRALHRACRSTRPATAWRWSTSIWTYGVRSAAAAAIACKWLAPAAPRTLGLVGVGSMADEFAALPDAALPVRGNPLHVATARNPRGVRRPLVSRTRHCGATRRHRRRGGARRRHRGRRHNVLRDHDARAVAQARLAVHFAGAPELDPDGWKHMDKVVLDSWEMNMRMPVFSSMVENGQFSKDMMYAEIADLVVGREARTCQRRGAYSPSYHGAGRARHRTGAPPLRQGAGDRTWNCVPAARPPQ